jgi:VWFA-related protein
MTRTAIVVMLAIAGVPLVAQTTRFRTGVAAVRVDALVTDGRRPLTGLAASNFELRDNGVVQKITDVSQETLPLNIICALDVSGSVEGMPLSQLKEGVTALVDALGAKDRAALMTFHNRLKVHTPLTGDRDRLRALVHDVKAGGSTSLFDAVFAGLALRDRRDGDDGRTLLLLFSDGRDTASWLTARKAIDAVRRNDVVVYPVTIRAIRPMITVQGKPISVDRMRPEPSQRFLDALADTSGGRVAYASSESALRTMFLDVLAEFRQRYVLSYEPAGVPGSGWHTIEVKLKGRSGEVRARRGYFARLGNDE